MPVKPIQPEMISTGMVLPRPIFTRQGIKLVGRGITLTEPMCEALRELASTPGEDGPQWNLFYADTASEMRTARILSEHRRLRTGERPERDVVTVGGRLPVEEDQETESVHEQAYSHGAYSNPDSRESRRHRAARMKLADSIVADLEHIWSSIPLRVTVGPDPIELGDTEGHDWPDAERLASFRADRVASLSDIYARCLAGVPTSIDQPLSIVDELIGLLVRFPQQYTQLSLLFPRGDDYLADHAYSTGVLCVAMAARLGWSRRDVRHCALAGLLADLGMTLIPREVRTASRPLTETEINRVWRHPTWSVVLMEDIEGMPESVRRAAYQHHERENGSGYPLRLRSTKISDYARVVAVADAYAATTQPRPFRRQVPPYQVIEHLIRVGSERMYDRKVVRALVESTGLFPVGSHVRLSSGEIAQVVGAHTGMPDRPVVRVYRRDEGRSVPGPLIDLADFEPWTLHVIQAVESPEPLVAA
ncbi:MAG: HD-GYP domain-containing protein [Phycisphaerales bacterium JB065]